MDLTTVKWFSSVASFLLLGGGGGQDPPNVPTEKKNVYVVYMRERAKRMSASEIYMYFRISKYICSMAL